MIMLEDALRDMFSARVDSTPSVHDPAGRAVRRGRSIRRRRATLSAVSAAVALVLIVGGVTSLGGWGKPGGRVAAPAAPFEPEPMPATRPTPHPTPTADPVAVAGTELDVRIGNQLRTADGRLLALTGVGRVTRIYRVPAGWVYGGADKVRLMRPDGTSIPLGGNGGGWAVSPDGSRLALGSGAALRVATLGPAGLSGPVGSAVPAGTSPVAFVGDRVVVSAPPQRPAGFDLIEPGTTRGLRWSTGIVGVYGVHGDSLVGLVPVGPDGKTCLAAIEVRPDGLAAPANAACPLVLPPVTGDVRLAPDGGWLAQPGDSGLLLVDVASALAGRPVVVDCGIRSSVPPVWVDNHTVLAAGEQGVIRCRTDGSRQLEALPAQPGEEWQFVPSLTPSPTGPANPAAATASPR